MDVPEANPQNTSSCTLHVPDGQVALAYLNQQRVKFEFSVLPALSLVGTSNA